MLNRQISYLHRGLQPFRIDVRVDGKITGRIGRDESGYFYRARGGFTGSHFSTVEAVKASLEG
jgi:hypothetical protein